MPSTVFFLDPGTHLLLETADPFHEELIEVGTDNGNIKEAVKQRHAAVTAFGKNPLVEGKPGQLAVQIPFRTVEIKYLWLRYLFFPCHGRLQEEGFLMFNTLNVSDIRTIIKA